MENEGMRRGKLSDPEGVRRKGGWGVQGRGYGSKLSCFSRGKVGLLAR